MVAFEVGKYLNCLKEGKQGYAVLKLDMSKAYDHIEWAFLRRMLEKLWFDQRWVKFIMLCVSTVEYMVAQNGMEIRPIIPKWGLRQGDLISLYIFIIGAEGLSSLLNGYLQDNLIHGCKIAHTAPVISHLFFADDSFIFFKANVLMALWETLGPNDQFLEIIDFV